MANICQTTYIVAGDETQLNDLREFFKKAYFESCGMMKTGYQDISKVVEMITGEENEDIFGEVIFADVDDKEKLTFDVDTKWCKNDEIEVEIGAFFPDLEVYWATEELGCGIFETNDYNGDFFSREYYYVSTCDEGEYFESTDELVTWLNEYFDKEVCTDLDSAIEFCDEHEGEDDYDNIFLYIREIV